MGKNPPSSVALTELVSYLDVLLEVEGARDYGPNGLQVEGRDTVTKLVTSVSACLELFDRADRAGADSVLVHHGLFWTGDDGSLTGVQYRRVKRLLDSGLSLLAYHLPLDRHPELGNNALAVQHLGLVDQQSFAVWEDEPIGFWGRFREPLAAAELFRRCETVFGQPPQTFGHGPQEISTVGVVSGAAERAFKEAIQLGLDAFITGEVSEWVPNLAREAETHFIAAGHYATERLGIRALGERLADHFGIEVEFIDIPNPV